MKRTSAVVLAVVVLAAALAAQQAPPPQRISVNVTQVKPEMLQAYQDLIRNEGVPAYKKAGIAWRHVFANGPFGQGFTFVTVTPITNYAQYDQQPGPIARAIGADGAAKYNAKLRAMIVSQHTTASTLQQNLSLVSNASTPAAFVVVQTIQPLPGRGNEYNAITEKEYVPIYKKAGIKDYWFYINNFGVPQSATIVRPISKLAELDQPNPLAEAMNKALGAEAAQKLNLRRNALLSVIGPTEVQRFVPELSFGMPNTKPTQ